MIYLSSPYSRTEKDNHEVSWLIREHRYHLVCLATSILMLERKFVFSPIVHCHEIAKMVEFPTDAAFWSDYNSKAIEAATEVYVLHLDGWERSIGVAWEIEIATELKKPIKHVKLSGDFKSLEEIIE